MMREPSSLYFNFPRQLLKTFAAQPLLESSAALIALLASLLLATVYNLPLWQKLFNLPGVTITGNAGFLFGMLVILTSIFFIFFSLVSYRYLLKTVVAVVIVLAATISYFSMRYGTVIDYNMIGNILETDIREAGELLSLPLVLHYLLFAGLPLLLLQQVSIRWRTPLKQCAINMAAVTVALAIAGITIYGNYSSLVLIGRQHKYLRMVINPTYGLYSAKKYYQIQHKVGQTVTPIAEDAVLEKHGISGKRKLLGIVVVGESARAKEFSLNGYQRDTNPCLAREQAVSFTKAYASGTSTAEALPCMFSHLKREEYSAKKAAGYENILDILQRLGVAVLWRDNNSSSKGVAKRIPYEKILPSLIPAGEQPDLVRDGECFDMALLLNLQQEIDQNPNDNILIVLHQKGSHGPAYWKRHPDSFCRFTSEYRGNAPQNSLTAELINAYDNTILYTDYFLGQTIALLKKNAADYDTFLLYMSDHGESLGEKGIYLHSLPYFMAPEEQKHIGAVVWLSESCARNRGVANLKTLLARREQPISHDHIFHSLLGIYHVRSTIYKPQLDIFHIDQSDVPWRGGLG